MKALSALAGLVALLAAPALGWAAGPISIVAAENFYGDVARQIGGASVTVISILSNPDQDPHLFEATPSVARNISAARIVVYNGIGYDPWMEKLLGASRRPDRRAIVVAPLGARAAGDNPHVWYDTQTVLAYAAVLTEVLAAEDPAGAAGFRQRLVGFQASMRPVQSKIAALRARVAGTPVTATEPVFGYMFDALGLRSRDQSFQLSVMNGTEPSAADIAAFENGLKTHQVKLLIYNSQASDPTAARMRSIAKAAEVAVVGATETEPAGMHYQAWMTSAVEAVDQALATQAPATRAAAK